MNNLERIFSRLDKIKREFKRLEKKHAELKLDQERLESESNYTDVRERWRSGKYLYLVHPMINGKRDQTYIGSDPEKIEAARAAQERGRAVRENDMEISRIHMKISITNENLEQIEAILEG